MHRYLLSGMFAGVLLFFLVVSAVPSHAVQPIIPLQRHKFFKSTPAQAPSTFIGATTSAKQIGTALSVSPTPTPIVPPKTTSSQTAVTSAQLSTPLVQPTSLPTTTPAVVSSSSDPFISAINQYRASQGLGPVQTDPNTCAFAKTRASEIVSNFSHDGFTSRLNNHTLPYSSYHEVTENIAMTSDPSQVIPMWIASPGHAANMRADTPYVCVQQSGNYFAYEGWKP